MAEANGNPILPDDSRGAYKHLSTKIAINVDPEHWFGTVQHGDVQVRRTKATRNTTDTKRLHAEPRFPNRGPKLRQHLLAILKTVLESMNTDSAGGHWFLTITDRRFRLPRAIDVGDFTTHFPRSPPFS